jgi:hypothetical protein
MYFGSPGLGFQLQSNPMHIEFQFENYTFLQNFNRLIIIIIINILVRVDKVNEFFVILLLPTSSSKLVSSTLAATSITSSCRSLSNSSSESDSADNITFAKS